MPTKKELASDQEEIRISTKRARGPKKGHGGSPKIRSTGKSTQFKPDDPATGFKDPRINRSGYIKPKNVKELDKLLDDLFKEKVVIERRTTKGKHQVVTHREEMSRLEYMLLTMTMEGDSRDRTEILARRFGKHREPVTGDESATAHEFNIPADLLAPDFLSVYRDIKGKKHVEYVLEGGRGSTKSSFVAEAIIWLLKNNPEMHALAMRQVGATLRDSVFNKLQWAILELGLSDEFKLTTSPLEITHHTTGQKIYFRGADDPGKVKSITPAFGYIGILWLEELDQFYGTEAVRKIEQSVLRGGDEGYIFKTYNPPQTTANWVNKYIQLPKANRLHHHSTYHTVPIEWLGKIWIEEAEHLKKINPKAYEHEYEGKANGTGAQVFDNVEVRAITDEEIKQFDHVMDGLDWGYFPDPAEYGKCHYDAARHTLYIFSEVRKWKHGNKEFYEAIKDEGGYKDADLLIADSAEPKSIGDFRSYGANCRGAEKGPESVRYSIKWLQSLNKIVIDNVRCPYAAEEFLNYQHEVTKDGEILSAYPDKDNHSIDRVRYATNLLWRRPGK